MDGHGAWQPIDTAPPDESILVFTSRWGPIIAERSSEFGEWLSRMQCPVSLREADEQPTHWMPMPAPPDGVEPPSSGRASTTDFG